MILYMLKFSERREFQYSKPREYERNNRFIGGFIGEEKNDWEGGGGDYPAQSTEQTQVFNLSIQGF